MAYGEVLAAMADPTRRHILEALRKQPKTVGELAKDQPVSRPAVSQHLKVLASAGLVGVSRKATDVYIESSAMDWMICGSIWTTTGQMSCLHMPPKSPDVSKNRSA